MNSTAVLVGAALATFSSSATAAVVVEAAGNGSLATAQNLNGNFTTDANANITDSTTIPHVTVVSTGSENEWDYYTFTVATGGTSGIFDIDGAYPGFDSWIELLMADGTLITANDDSSVDPGSNLTCCGITFDSYLTYTFANAGTYAMRVGSFPAQPRNGAYELHVSLEAPGGPGAVPEPGTWAMMLMGFGAMGISLKRRRKTFALA